MLKKLLSRLFPKWFSSSGNSSFGNGPNPRQSDLDKILKKTNRLRLVTENPSGLSRNVPPEVLTALMKGETIDPQYIDPNKEGQVHLDVQGAVVEEAKEYLKIRAGGHLMHHTSRYLEFYQDDIQLARMGVLAHGDYLRWEKWGYDAVLLDDRFIEWLDRQGFPWYVKSKKKALEEAQEYKRKDKSWLAAMPECLKPFWDEKMRSGITPRNLAPLEKTLSRSYPEFSEKILILFEWYGSGTGTWNCFPGYESLPMELLLQYHTKDIVQSIEDIELNTSQLEGAIRYFSGWDFNQKKEEEKIFLSDKLKERFRNHIKNSSGESNRVLGQGAFDTEEQSKNPETPPEHQ